MNIGTWARINLVFWAVLLIQIGPTVGQKPAGADLQSMLLAEPVESIVQDVIRDGNAYQGAVEYYRLELNCVQCHESGANGRRLGPILSRQRDVEVSHLVQSVLSPSSTIDREYKTVVVQTIDGENLNGVLINENDSSITIDRIEEVDQPLEIAKSDIEDWRFSRKSIMPDQLVNQMTSRQQFLDLVKYLAEVAEKGEEWAKELRPSSASLALPPLPDYEASIDHAGLIQSLDDDSFENGKEIYRLRCASCHGTYESEGSMPTSLRFGQAKFKNGGDPYSMYKTLTHGFGMMNAQRWMVPIQKYEVVHYIREAFLNQGDEEYLFEVSDEYLAELPNGDETGPEPVSNHPWSAMDYGPSLNNTIEVSDDGSNIAQKGIAIRLDSGPGGVAAGKHWMLYDHDTMRVSAAWSGGFMDYNGIHFNGVHNQHPRIDEPVHFSNPNIPGWARPITESFNDERLVGRDGKRYGRLPNEWLKFEGQFRFGNHVVMKYRVGATDILESPSLRFADSNPVFVRHIEIGNRSSDLIIQVARPESFKKPSVENGSILIVNRVEQGSEGEHSAIQTSLAAKDFQWEYSEDGDIRMRIKAGKEKLRFELSIACGIDKQFFDSPSAQRQITNGESNLNRMTKGGTANWPQTIKTEWKTTQTGGPFEVDTFVRPVENPWNDRMRLTGIDFYENGRDAVVSCWDGSVYRVSGIDKESTRENATITWR